MNEADKFNIFCNEKYGAQILTESEDLADEIDDYLSEKYYIFYDRSFSDGEYAFHFGQASDVEKVKSIMSNFKN